MLARMTRQDKSNVTKWPYHTAFTLLIQACCFLAQLTGKHAQRHQRPLSLFVPRRATVESNAVIKLLGITENKPGRDTDPLLQSPHVQLLGIDPTRQTDPQNEPAARARYLCTFGKILLNCQLECAQVFTVLLSDMP